MINIYKPYLPPESLKYAHDALNSTWISSQGKYLNMVSEELKTILNIKYLHLLNNGTSACHLVSKALYKKFPPTNGNKKIIVPNNVYAAAWNSFLFDGNYELIPIDADIKTWNMNILKLEETINKYPEADVLIVHNIGNIINVPSLKRKFTKTNFVEDNCEGFLGKYEDKYTGTESFASSISFFGNKNITSGEGGAVLTNCEKSYEYIKCIQGQGQSSIRFLHNELGYNYRMTNIQAAILYGQIKNIQNIIDLKREVFQLYIKEFKDHDKIRIQINDLNTLNSNWMFGIRVLGQKSYVQAENYFKSKNIEVRPMFFSILSHKYMKNNSKLLLSEFDSTIADLLNKECFILPSFPELTKCEQNYIINSIYEYLRQI